MSSDRAEEPHQFRRPSRSLGSLLSSAAQQAKSIAAAELEIAKIKAKKAGKSMAIGIGLFVFAGLLALFLLWWLFHSVELAFALIVPAWAASLITAGILLLLIVIVALIGIRAMKKGQRELPDVKAGLQADATIVKEGLSNE